MSEIKIRIGKDDRNSKLLSMGAWGLAGGLAFGTVGAVAGVLLGGVRDDDDFDDACCVSVNFDNDGDDETLLFDEESLEKLTDLGVDVDFDLRINASR